MLRKIKIYNYKNLNTELTFDNRITLIIAKNGAGKTNTLEAIYYSTNGFDFKKTADLLSINSNSIEKEFSIGADFELENKNHSQIFKSITFTAKNRATKHLKVNGKSRLGIEYSKDTRAVIFSPESIDLITSGPDLRRAEIDNLLCLKSKEYHKLFLEFNNTLKNRNKYLKSISKNYPNLTQINDKVYEFWTVRFLENADAIYQARILAINKISELSNNIAPVYHFGSNIFELKYIQKSLSSNSSENYRDTLSHVIKSNFLKESVNGTSLYGPHRDDISVLLNDFTLRDFGSRAQQRIASFIIKLAEIEFLEIDNDKKEIDNLLLLDDLPSELDELHIRNIEVELQKSKLQIILTATSDKYFSEEFKKNAQLIYI